MESMLEFCTAVSKSIDLKFNVKKSSVIRIDKRCNIKCSTLLLDGNVVSYVDEIKYLGITIKKGSRSVDLGALKKLNFIDVSMRSTARRILLLKIY